MKLQERPSSFTERFYFFEIMKGMAVTMRHFIKSIVSRKTAMPTISYPEHRQEYSNRFRGAHILTKNAEGHLKCVACYMCATACPAECIHIVAQEDPDPTIEKAPESFKIDLLRCVMCGMCVDACPKEAIIMSGEYELSVFSRQDAVYGIDLLTERPNMEKQKLGYRPRYDAGPFADGKQGQNARHPSGVQ